MILTFEALQADDGDCLLLHYERPRTRPVRILVDGGSRGIYTRVLRPRLDELRAGRRLDLRMVMVSHIDADHITGLLDLFRDLERQRDDMAEPFCQIRTLWHNAFETLHQGRQAVTQSAVVSAAIGGTVPPGLTDFTAAVIGSVKQGADLRRAADRLNVPVNQGAADTLVRAPRTGVRRITVAPGLTLTILGPNDAQLQKLDAEWQKSRAAHPDNPQAQAADYLNRTVPNLSSIVALVEADRGEDAPPLRVLLTGDAGGDHILTSLDESGVAPGGRIHLDLLKVQHHGSNHSVTRDFFERVTADHYVISGNGAHHNPHADTLAWLSGARADQPYQVYLTNRDGRNHLGHTLGAFLETESAAQPTHRYHFRPASALSISIALT